MIVRRVVAVWSVAGESRNSITGISRSQGRTPQSRVGVGILRTVTAPWGTQSTRLNYASVSTRYLYFLPRFGNLRKFCSKCVLYFFFVSTYAHLGKRFVWSYTAMQALEVFSSQYDLQGRKVIFNHSNQSKPSVHWPLKYSDCSEWCWRHFETFHRSLHSNEPTCPTFFSRGSLILIYFTYRGW